MRLLFLSAPMLVPANTGGRIRSLHLVSRLAKRHHVTFLCFRTPNDSDASAGEMARACSRIETVAWSDTAKFTGPFYRELALALFSRLPYSVWKYRSAPMRAALLRAATSGAYDALICDFLQPFVNVPTPFPLPVVLFQHNVEAQILRRQVEHTTNPVARTYLRLEHRKLRAFERDTMRRATHSIMVSNEDLQLAADQYGVVNASVVPTGVDTNYFQPSEDSDTTANIVFTGSMDWLPNEDAARYFVSDVLPLVQREEQVTFRVVGRNPLPGLLRLAKDRSDIVVTGTVADIRPELARAAVVVVPLRIGGGTRIKIFEAMAAAKAVVSTTVGAEGLPVRPGEHLLVADRPADLAAAIVGLLRDVQRRRALGHAARALVAGRYSWDAAADTFAAACQHAISAHRRTRGCG